jgi:hypothetical protein
METFEINIHKCWCGSRFTHRESAIKHAKVGTYHNIDVISSASVSIYNANNLDRDPSGRIYNKDDNSTSTIQLVLSPDTSEKDLSVYMATLELAGYNYTYAKEVGNIITIRIALATDTTRNDLIDYLTVLKRTGFRPNTGKIDCPLL